MQLLKNRGENAVNCLFSVLKQDTVKKEKYFNNYRQAKKHFWLMHIRSHDTYGSKFLEIVLGI